MEILTADLCDHFMAQINVAYPIGFRDYGKRRRFHGEIVTVKCHEANPLVRQTLEGPGSGKVLVVDGGGSIRCALVGDNIAKMALDNGWEGIVVYGCIRDSAEIATLPIGLKALGTNPTKSRKVAEGQVNIPLRFAHIDFVPGQFIYCDEDGIVVSEKLLMAQ